MTTNNKTWSGEIQTRTAIPSGAQAIDRLLAAKLLGVLLMVPTLAFLGWLLGVYNILPNQMSGTVWATRVQEFSPVCRAAGVLWAWVGGGLGLLVGLCTRPRSR